MVEKHDSTNSSTWPLSGRCKEQKHQRRDNGIRATGVALPCHGVENGEATFWLGVVAFGKQAEALAPHRKGDIVSVSGNMQINQWTAQGGPTASGYQVLADSVVSARTVKPAGRKGQQRQAGATLHRAQESQASQPQSTPSSQKKRKRWESLGYGDGLRDVGWM